MSAWRRALRAPGITLAVVVAASAAAAHLVESLLYGVSPADPWAFLGVPTALAVTVLLACLPPARRAARVDPAENLRAL